MPLMIGDCTHGLGQPQAYRIDALDCRKRPVLSLIFFTDPSHEITRLIVTADFYGPFTVWLCYSIG